MATVLDNIKAYKLEEIARAKIGMPLAALEEQVKTASSVRNFEAALRDHIDQGRYGLICEIKKASPSKGLIREDFDPPVLARAYERGGATCLSVLTDTPSFQGSPDFLRAARAVTSLPVLRKDFMYDPYQVFEARAWGADCILIILASVSDAQAQELEQVAHSLGMGVLIEMHNEEELVRALNLKSALFGINNRNLKSFETNLETTEQLSHLVPGNRLLISESGINTPADLARLSESGAQSFLIGESLMRQENVEAATAELSSLKC